MEKEENQVSMCENYLSKSSCKVITKKNLEIKTSNISFQWPMESFMEVPQNVDEETVEFLCPCPGISSVYNWVVL